MSEPVLSVDYWRRRLEQARSAGQLHLSVFRCPLDRWQRIEAKHREILARTIAPFDDVLDAGCGYGRLLDLMPQMWTGHYLGVDISPDLVDLARERYPLRMFSVCDMRSIVVASAKSFEWAVLISVRPMVKRNCGDDVWQQMEAELRRVAKRRLYLEYDPECEGFIE